MLKQTLFMIDSSDGTFALHQSKKSGAPMSLNALCRTVAFLQVNRLSFPTLHLGFNLPPRACSGAFEFIHKD